MCFVLYAGTSTSLPDTEWRDDAPDLAIKPLTDRENPITTHFSKPHVQYVGSTSQCGCDFPHVIYQSGEWPWYEDDKEDEFDHQRKEAEKDNRERLVTLLRQINESSVELYGVWDGDFDTPPLIREEISVDAILDSGFRFKERGFYTVRLADVEG